MKRAVPVARPTTPPRRRPFPRAAVLALAVTIGIAVAVKALFFHPSDFEGVAHDVTAALQRNDLAAVEKYQNAETATHVDHARVGRAADALAPLGELESVKETAADEATRIHDFDLKFAHGTLHEKIKFDPEKKIVTFHYDDPQLVK